MLRLRAYIINEGIEIYICRNFALNIEFVELKLQIRFKDQMIRAGEKNRPLLFECPCDPTIRPLISFDMI